MERLEGTQTVTESLRADPVGKAKSTHTRHCEGEAEEKGRLSNGLAPRVNARCADPQRDTSQEALGQGQPGP